jgi:hypothetical protein
MIGFGEPAEPPAATVEWAPPIEPFVPAAEDLAALAPAMPVSPLAISEPEPEPKAERASVKAEPEPERVPASPPVKPEPTAADELTIPARTLAGRLSDRLGDPAPPPGLNEAAPPATSALSAAPPSAMAQQAAEQPQPVTRERLWPPPTAVAPNAMPALDQAGDEHRPRNRRLHRRVRLPAQIEIDGVRCSLIDVSVGGFAVTGFPAAAVNTVVPVALHLTIDGIEVGTQLSARIIYANAVRSSGRFVDASASQTAFLRYLVTWRGESVGAVGATTLLDAISGGHERAGADKSPDRVEDAPKERWWAGLMGRKVSPPR